MDSRNDSSVWQGLDVRIEFQAQVGILGLDHDLPNVVTPFRPRACRSRRLAVVRRSLRRADAPAGVQRVLRSLLSDAPAGIQREKGEMLKPDKGYIFASSKVFRELDLRTLARVCKGVSGTVLAEFPRA